MQLAPGTLIDEKFEVVCQLGAGAYGTVLKARHVHLDRMVALKILHADTVDDKDALARFHREARIISSLQHENICRSFGFGVWQSLPYIALEFLRGVSLQSLLGERKRLGWDEINSLFPQVCDGLQYAHERGVVHRDLKPSNIFLVEDEPKQTLKLIDFGLAKQTDTIYGMSQKLTETGVTVGTCHYMSPEQCLGKPADARSDVYALGCILYECLSGSPPFDADNGVAVMYMHVHDKAKDIDAPQLPSPLRHNLQLLIDASMEKDPTRRLQSCSAFRTVLQELKQNSSRTALVSLNPVRTKSARKVGSLALASGMACITAALVYMLYSQNHQTPETLPLDNSRQEMMSRQVPATVQSDIDAADLIQTRGEWNHALDAWKKLVDKIEFKTSSQYNIAYAYIRMAECYANLGDWTSCERMRNLSMQYKTTHPPIAPDSLTLARIDAIKRLSDGNKDGAVKALLASMQNVRYLQTNSVMRNANLLLRLCPARSKYDDQLEAALRNAIPQVEDSNSQAALYNILSQYAYFHGDFKTCRSLAKAAFDRCSVPEFHLSELFVVIDCSCRMHDVKTAQQWLGLYRNKYASEDQAPAAIRLALTQAAIDAAAGRLDESVSVVRKWAPTLRDPHRNPDHVTIRALQNIAAVFKAANRKEASELDDLCNAMTETVNRFARSQPQMVD